MGISHKVIVCAAAVLAAASAMTVSAEVAPFLQSGRPLEHVEAASGAALPFGFSTYSRKLSLDQCRFALSNPSARLLPEEEKARALDTCTSTALAILERSPTNAYAAAVAGYATALKGDTDGATSFLRLSQRLAPSQAWLATFRLRTRTENLLAIGADDASLAADVRLLGGTWKGRRWLANWYGNRPQARDFIVAEIESLPPSDQRSFLQAVREYMATLPAQGART